jgi:hypothetical protein
MDRRPSILDLAEQENKNLERGLELLGDTYILVTDLETVYDALPHYCGPFKNVETNDAAFAAGVIAHLVFMCRRQLTVGTLTLLRGYRGDHKYHLRKAIETCAFAARMERHPHMARIWLTAGGDDEAFEKFRKKFTNLFPQDDPHLVELGKHYDVCAKPTHPSMYGVAPYFATHHAHHPSTAGLDVFDARTEAVVVAEFVISILVYLLIIQVFERLLKPYTGDRLKQWSIRRDECEKNYLIAQRHWQPFVMESIERLHGSTA